MFSLRLAGVSFALLFTIACGSDYSLPPTTPSPSPAPPAGGNTSPVSIQAGAEALGNRAYAPADLDVAAGTTVTWTKNDSEGHTTDSDAPGFNSDIIPPAGRSPSHFQRQGHSPTTAAFTPEWWAG